MMHSIDRRAFLMLAGAAPCVRAQKPDASVTIALDSEIGPISPLIYGQFTEHIGELIYGGIWVGPNSKIPNRNGFRLDTLKALKGVSPSVIRWPGGCFGDAYHWKDGVGPRDKRSARRNHWWHRDEPNTFGTDEFIAWCEMLRTQPYLSVNVGSGTVGEALDWLEYCNGPANSGWGAARSRNGRENPYGVRFWGIGNENWGCGGSFTAAEYAQQFRQYGVYFKRLGLTAGLELVGVGHNVGDWNRKFLAALGAGLPYLDHLSVHRYFRRGHSTQFSDADHTNLMLDLTSFEDLIVDAIRALDEVAAARSQIRLFGKLQPKPVGLILDEWGVWHDDARFEDGFSQKGVLREALFAASCLNLFHKYATRISMTNIAQVLNCLQSLLLTDGASLTLTPTYHVYQMYRPHQGATALRTELEASPLIGAGGVTRPVLSHSASKRNRSVLLTLVNQSPREDLDVEIKLRGGRVVETKATNLTGASVRTENTKDSPDAVSPKAWKIESASGGLRTKVPAHSVQAIEMLL